MSVVGGQPEVCVDRRDFLFDPNETWARGRRGLHAAGQGWNILTPSAQLTVEPIPVIILLWLFFGRRTVPVDLEQT
jgi:hypothetical protein